MLRSRRSIPAPHHPLSKATTYAAPTHPQTATPLTTPTPSFFSPRFSLTQPSSRVQRLHHGYTRLTRPSLLLPTKPIPHMTASTSSQRKASSSSSSSPSSSRPPTLRLQSTRIALVQLGQTSKDKSFNIKHAREHIVKAAKEGDGADMIVLPECWNSPYGVQYFNDYAEEFGGLWEKVKRPIDRRGSRSRVRDEEEEDDEGHNDTDEGRTGRTLQSASRVAPVSPHEANLLRRWGVDGLGGAALEVDFATCQSESIKFMSSIARELGVVLVGGSIPERNAADGKLFNTATVFDQKGRLIAIHRKVHLFDIDIPGKMTFQESLTLTGGDRVSIFECSLGRFGLGICYDMRFPELAAIAARLGAGAMIYPGAFNTTTGPRHWELLQRCRAMDNQIYVIACSPARASEEEIKAGSYPAWGHSTVTDPWAQVVATTEEQETIVRWTLQPEVVEEVRKGIPITRQRRYDVYNDPALA